MVRMDTLRVFCKFWKKPGLIEQLERIWRIRPCT